MFELGEEGKLEIVSVDDFLSLADMDDKEDLKEGENAGGEDGGNDKSTEEEGATADDTNNNTSNEGAGNNEEEEVKIPKTDYKGILSDLMSRGIINDISDYEFQVGEND